MAPGIMLVNAVPKAGKTVAVAALAGCLKESGFQVQAVKPVDIYGALQAPPDYNHDQRFIDSVLNPMQSFETVVLPTPSEFNPLLWKRLIEQLSNAPYPLLLESVSTVASAFRYPTETPHGSAHAVIDAVDLARLLNLKIILVTPKSHHLYADLAPAIAYLAQRHERALAWIAVGNTPESDLIDPMEWEQASLMIAHDYQLPCFGEIAYSASISVENLQQGNLLRQTENGIDFLPLQQAMAFALI
ncbi:MAG: hypothetical protein VKJ04_00340 [Vampirovibrionales bacterium]|nr:hypothetical protein [Vampirovibrionales bacterium]